MFEEKLTPFFYRFKVSAGLLKPLFTIDMGRMLEEHEEV